MVHCFFNILQTADVQIGFLLAGKGCIGQVFGGGGRAHGNRNVFAARFCNQFVPRGFQFGFQMLGERGIQNPLANFRTHARQLGHIVHIQLGKCIGNALVQPALRQKCAIGIGGGGKTAGHAHAFACKLRNHFAQ